ncbi:MAG: cyclomaltodextrin glucanotransferase [Xanthomonadales bacterium]|nr:cyclomaltodextrin glucanotransferase [Xanthomonadales bacterium]
MRAGNGAMLALATALLAGCAQTGAPTARPAAVAAPAYYGTTEPFAAEAVYFVVTDRFVNGDESNDQRAQGGAHPSFDIPIAGPDGRSDNIGYLGGDFQGIVDHLDYIKDMGFGAVWITPIIDNPDQAFTGGTPATWGSMWTDQGKTGYHGYWGVNFYRLDEHLPSAGLDFAGFTAALHAKDVKVVLDIVANHGSPAFTMPVAQPQYGQIFDADGELVADQQNLPPDQLDPGYNPLHRFYNRKSDLAQLSDLREDSPEVMDYLIGAYLQWIGQGADAFRIDTVSLMPGEFWDRFTARIREKHPGYFMFGEVFDYDAAKIAAYTQPGGGSISVLDFPLKQQLARVFGREGGDYALLGPALFLDGGPYRNPYELMTFYDNHDMARLDASDAGFIDAHHWLFTARGIPVVYYGSEIGFERGSPELAGNRNYFGTEGIAAARAHPIRAALARIAKVRANSPALQRGLQVNVALAGDLAAFYRVYQREGASQIALVLLNKGDAAADFEVSAMLEPGIWTPALDGDAVTVGTGGSLRASVPAHGAQVYLHAGPVTRSDLAAQLSRQMVAR